MDRVYVFGHRNPDTDSVCSAITLSYLKRELGMNAIPAVLSSINLESKYALDYFNVPVPIFLNDVKLKVKDLSYNKKYFAMDTDSIHSAYYKMGDADISKIPVVDSSRNLLGILSMKDIAKTEFSGKYEEVDTTYSNIIETINGEEVLKFDDEVAGNLIVASYKSTTILSNVKMDSNTILIVGDRYSVIEYAVKCGVKLIVVTGNHDIGDNNLKIAIDNRVNIISTPYDTLNTTKMFYLANKVSCVLNKEKLLCINDNTDVKDFINIANKTRYSYYPVTNKKNKCMGILRLSDAVFDNKKKVILVDHNSYEQSAIGLEETEILEIVDHHNIGSIGTNMPISFRNMPVGSTNTIINLLYKENSIKIHKYIAGMMLSGILSDTLILNSPTTTDYDRKAVEYLSKIAHVDYKKYGYDMIKAGSSLSGMTMEQVLYKDYKNYTIDNKNIGLGQVITMDVNEILNKKDEYIDLLNTISDKNNYLFVCLFVTNVIDNGTYVLYSDRAFDVLKSAFDVDDMREGVFLKGIVSRKKQILPSIMIEMGQ